MYKFFLNLLVRIPCWRQLFVPCGERFALNVKGKIILTTENNG